MKPIEELSVNEWNYQAPAVDARDGDYWHYLVADLGRLDIPLEVGSNSATTEDSGYRPAEGRE